MTAKKNEVTPMNRKARKAVFKKGEEARISVISNLQVDHMPDRDEADHIQKNQTAKADEADRIGRHFQVEAAIGQTARPEERRVGKAGGSTCRTRRQTCNDHITHDNLPTPIRNHL